MSWFKETWLRSNWHKNKMCPTKGCLSRVEQIIVVLVGRTRIGRSLEYSTRQKHATIGGWSGHKETFLEVEENAKESSSKSSIFEDASYVYVWNNGGALVVIHEYKGDKD